MSMAKESGSEIYSKDTAEVLTDDEDIKDGVSNVKQKETKQMKPLTYSQSALGRKDTLPKGSSAFQQVLQEIYREMEEEAHHRSEKSEDVDKVKDPREPGRHRNHSGPTANFIRTSSVSGGYSGTFVRMQSRKMLLRSKSSRELLLEKLAIKT